MKFRRTCQEVSRLISEGLDAQLPAAERARVQMHFFRCHNCRNVNEQLDFLRRAMRQLGKDETPGS